MKKFIIMPKDRNLDPELAQKLANFLKNKENNFVVFNKRVDLEIIQLDNTEKRPWYRRLFGI